MAKKLKLDTTKLKQFALEKGERVGLGVAVLVMFFFVGYGVIRGLAQTSPVEDLKKNTARVNGLIATSNPPDTAPEGAPAALADNESKLGDWGPARPELIASTGSWFDPGAAGDPKRLNPTVLPVGELAGGNLKNIRINYLNCGVPTYEYKEKKETLGTVKPAGAVGIAMPSAGPAAAGGGGTAEFAKVLHPTRMVVVYATFPLRDQLEVTRKALRLASISDLLSTQGGPRFLGLNVYRYEIVGGKTSPPQVVFEADDKGRIVVGGAETKVLLTTAEFDKASTDQVVGHLLPGLATPLPKLANASYPRVELSGIVVKGEEGDGTVVPVPAIKPPGGSRPGGSRMTMPGGKQPGIPPRPASGAGNDEEPTGTVGNPLPISKLPDMGKQEILDQLKGDYNVFDAYAKPFPDEGADAKPPPLPVVQTPMRAPAKGSPPANPVAEGDKVVEKVLVRFFDADVKPGKTYQYSIEVRMANPNFGKTDVAYASLAAEKVLLSPRTITPPIKIPTEYFVYAVDIAPKKLESKAIGPKGTENAELTRDVTPVQIQRWADVVKNEGGGGDPYEVADWVIAERLLIHRGEKLAREGVEVELPKWNKLRTPGGAFDLASSGGSSKGQAGKRTRHVAPVDFVPSNPDEPSVLVDFVGGKRVYDPQGARTHDDCSTEMLIVRPDGKLAVQTSWEDTDPQSPRGREQAERYEAWRRRISDLRPGKNSGN